MTVRSDTPSRTTPAGLGEAAVAAIGDLGPGDLLAGITPDHLGKRSGYAPSSIRYQLSRTARTLDGTARDKGGRWAFDREQVLLLALQVVTEAQTEAARHSAERFSLALGHEAATVRRALLDAIAFDLDALADRGVRAGEPHRFRRVWLVALASADVSPAVCGVLDACREVQSVLLTEVVQLALTRTGRVPRPGRSPQELAGQLLDLLHGFAGQACAGRPTAPERALESAVGLLAGLTTPSAGADPAFALSALLD